MCKRRNVNKKPNHPNCPLPFHTQKKLKFQKKNIHCPAELDLKIIKAVCILYYQTKIPFKWVMLVEPAEKRLQIKFKIHIKCVFLALLINIYMQIH